ncbi:MAG: hypothetical protein FJ125_14125, partial [Deltaproteobacteria bacterium]|nr:hypothetical protein [Deltaproteobacteria bacterium]
MMMPAGGEVVMEFTCKRCLSRFTFPDERVPETPVELRCISCGAPILIARSLGSTLDRIGAPLPESEGPSSDGLSSLDQAVSELEALMDSAKASYPAGPATVIEEDVDVELEEGDEQSTALLQNLDLDALDALMAAVEEPELERAVAAWPSAPEPAAPEPAAPEPAAPEPAAPELPALLVPPRRFDPSSLRLPRSLAPPVPLSRPLLPDMGSKRAAPPPLPWNVEQHPREEPVAATLATVRRFPPPLPPAAAEEQKTPIAAPSSKLLEVTGALVGRISAASMAAVQEKPSSLRGASSAAAPPPRSLASAAPAAASPAPPPAGAAGGAARPHEVGTRTTSPWFPTSTAKLAAAMPERLAAAEAGPAGAPPLPAAEPEPETAAEPELTTEPEPEAAAEPELAAEPEPETAA